MIFQLVSELILVKFQKEFQEKCPRKPNWCLNETVTVHTMIWRHFNNVHQFHRSTLDLIDSEFCAKVNEIN